METVKQLIEKLKELPAETKIYNEQGVNSFLELNLISPKKDRKKIIGVVLTTKINAESERLLSED